MSFSYTKLAILLLRIQGVITILHSIPSVTSALISILSRDDVMKHSNFMLGYFFQPLIGLILYLFAVPLATRAVGFLESRNQNEN